jgi:hypothetical protein
MDVCMDVILRMFIHLFVYLLIYLRGFDICEFRKFAIRNMRNIYLYYFKFNFLISFCSHCILAVLILNFISYLFVVTWILYFLFYLLEYFDSKIIVLIINMNK